MTLKEALDVMLDDEVVIMTARERSIVATPCTLRDILRDDVLAHEVAVLTCVPDENRLAIWLANYGDDD